MLHYSLEKVYPASKIEVDGRLFQLARFDSGEKRLIITDPGNPPTEFEGLLPLNESSPEPGQTGLTSWHCPTTAHNAALLRAALPWLKPSKLGLQTSFGFGDRLGLATPGHLAALEDPGLPQSAIAPIFAQQSVRENARTSRTPQSVLDDAMWGVFEKGWRSAWGADADHLKTVQDIDVFLAAGYTFFTFDPGAYVDSAADSDSLEVLRRKVAGLPWERLQSSPEEMYREFLGKFAMEFSETTLLRAAAKYGGAVAQVADLYRHLEKSCRVPLGGELPLDVEISVDETDTPTSIEEHYWIARQLLRLDVHWVSLAPRFVGRFEKGVDYIGSLDEFGEDVQKHADLARALGPYKISLHSGSDKFSIYPLAQAATNGLIHVKTAGTSYLEALRVMAQVEPALFRQILDFSRQRYETDRATYHVSAELARVPASAALADGDLPGLLEDFDARQVLHVAYGSALDEYGDELKRILKLRQELYDQTLKRHFDRHLAAMFSIAPFR